MSKASPMTTSAMAPPHYSLHSTLLRGLSLLSASLAIVTRSSCLSCAVWMPVFLPNWMSTWWWTITPPTSIPRCALGLAQRPRFHMHYTPTYSSWLNQVERWFGLITQRAIRRGSFRSVKELVQKIDDFVHHYNRKQRPFVWTATADSILAKIARLCSRISGTRH